MTLPMQTLGAPKAESAHGSCDVFSPDMFRSSHFLNISSNTNSLYPEEVRVHEVWQTWEQLLRANRLRWTLRESSSNTASEAHLVAGTGILAIKDIDVGTTGASGYELLDAAKDLEEVIDEAREEGFPVPSNSALEYARTILYAVYELSPRRYEVYPTPDGEVAIDAPGGFGRSVLLLCASDGGALCLVNMNGSHRRARYSDATMLPDGFVREALAELDRWNEPAA